MPKFILALTGLFAVILAFQNCGGPMASTNSVQSSSTNELLCQEGECQQYRDGEYVGDWNFNSDFNSADQFVLPDADDGDIPPGPVNGEQDSGNHGNNNQDANNDSSGSSSGGQDSGSSGGSESADNSNSGGSGSSNNNPLPAPQQNPRDGKMFFAVAAWETSNGRIAVATTEQGGGGGMTASKADDRCYDFKTYSGSDGGFQNHKNAAAYICVQGGEAFSYKSGIAAYIKSSCGKSLSLGRRCVNVHEEILKKLREMESSDTAKYEEYLTRQ